ncbi:MAG: TM0106 family RecB-like putative nuclease [Sporichthyaceae bacterium]
MNLSGDGLVLSPTDLTKHLACAHLTTLDMRAARGELEAPDEVDEALEIVFRLGLDHEASYLADLKTRGLNVVEIAEKQPLTSRVAQTTAAMLAGAEVIYQATFLHGDRRGHADFLLRVNEPSGLGPYSYDVADTKLARRMKVAALVQMAEYGTHLQRLQGRPPSWLTVVTGDKAERRYRYADVAAYAERAARRLREAIADPAPTDAEPTAHCAQCRWAARCEIGWRRADHLSLVAFMRSDHRHALEDAGITTVAALAAADPASLPSTIGATSRARLHSQAGLQMRERMTKSPHFELLDPAPGQGLLRLPEPSVGDVYLDFEGDPYAEGGEGREYLAGIWDRAGEFTTFWAHNRDEELVLTRDLLAHLVARVKADPGAHIYHYAPYERTALARLTQRHAVGEADFDLLLRGERLVDLYAVVRQGLRVSKESYSIKKLEDFYWDESKRHGLKGDGVANAMSSVIEYERWTVEGGQQILDDIAEYNREDVESTHDLHVWLEKRRAELEAEHGPQPRPAHGDGAPTEALRESQAAEVALADELRAAGHALLGGLVGWHRREDKPGWWDHFRVGDLSDDELTADGACIGGIGEPLSLGPLPKPARSTIWRYPFPPQDTKVSGKGFDVDTHKLAGEITSLDPEAGWLDLKVGNGKQPPRPRGLGPEPPIDAKAMRESLARTAREILDDAQPLGRALLDRVVPAGLAPSAGELPRDVVVRVGRHLGGTALAVQGPPGSGKTTVGAELIRALLDDGLRVGVTAQSHAVIANLLKAVGRRALHKNKPAPPAGLIQHTGENNDVVRALTDGTHNLVGGTQWLWAREDLEDSLDVLVIDEAGQFSLANAVAVSRAAAGLVLLGDPQQLMQPTQAQHPDGAGISALNHLLDGAPTIPADRGVFLDLTYRMHPELADVVSRLMYEGRLESAPDRERQLVHAAPWVGAGVRWVPVAHVANESTSPSEVARVAEIAADLLAGTWTDCDGAEHPVGPTDVLVVAPYNAHVARLRAALPDGVRVGTVDKFQGQEAPVVIYSLASSSAADAPRGIDFLYDTHRLNVAISRAKALAIVVGSPTLLDSAVRNPDQLRKVNGLIAVTQTR